MQNINTEIELRASILFLESRQMEEGRMLKEQFMLAYESIKPVNLIKSTIMEAAESSNLQDNLLNATVGLTAGYLSKVMFQSVTNSPIKKILGTALMFGIKNLVAQNPETVKALGKGFFEMIKNMLHKRGEDAEDNEKQEVPA